MYEVNNGERKSLSPGEGVTLTRVKSLHLHPYVSPPTPVSQREPSKRWWEPGAVEKPPKDAPVEVRLKALILRAIEVEEKEIVPSASLLEDLGADSIDLVEFVLFMVEEFSIHINDEEAMQILTVGEALEYLHNKGIV